MDRFALIVGISEYDDENFNSLNKAYTDAHAVAKCLGQDKRYTTKPEVLAGRVTKAQLETALTKLLVNQADNSEVLLYFTGHGFTTSSLGRPSQAFLATSNCIVTYESSQVTEQMRGFALTDLSALIKSSNASSLVVLLDACHSGFFLEEDLVKGTLASSGKDYYLIASCQGFAESYANKRDIHSVFTEALLAGLSNEIDENRHVTAGRLSDFISIRLRGSKQKSTSLGGGGSIIVMEHQPKIDEENDFSENYSFLDLFLQSLPKTITSVAIENLLEILTLEDIRDSIYKAYDACLPLVWLGATAADFRRTNANYEELLETLNQQVRRQEGKLPPIFEFTSRLVVDKNTSQVVRENLKEWVLENLKKDEFTSPVSTQNTYKVRSYLLIRLKPTKKLKGQFFVKAWLVPDDKADAGYGRFKPLNTEDLNEGPYPLEQIPKLLEYFHLQALEKLEAIDSKLVIEFFLPQDCLCTEVDSWEVLDVVNRPFQVGTEYQVVVRSYERLLPRYRKLAMKPWKQKWSQAKQLQPPLPQDVFELLNKVDGYEWNSLRATLLDKIGLKLTCPPIVVGSGSSVSQSDIIDALLSTAIPIAIWPRCLTSGADLADLINSLIEEGPLSELPEYVRKKRQEAVQKQIKDHLGQHLVLLWEDPDRLPPDEENLEFQVS